MRYTRLIASLVLATSLVFIFVISVSASASNYSLYVSHIEAEYQQANYENYYTSSETDDTFTFTGIPSSITVNDELRNLVTLSLISYPNDSDIEFTQGYIYTFNFTVRINGIVVENVPTISFGICDFGSNGFIDNYLSLGDVTYTIDKVNLRANVYNCTCVVKVDDNFNVNGIDLPTSSFSINFSNIFLQDSTATISLLASNCTYTKAIGEDAYYQASIDAISALPNDMINAEYDFAMAKLPDDNETIELIQGDLDDMLLETKNELNGVNNLLDSFNYQEPLIYMPPINIPLGKGVNIDLYDTKLSNYVDGNGYFHPLNLLSQMNPSIITWINTAKMFIVFVALVTFMSYGVFKMTRIEWWLN